MRDPEFVVSGSFIDEAGARAGEDALRAAGMADDRLDVRRVALRASGPGSHLEARFVWRLVWIVVWWSIVGGVAGAALGALAWWAGIGGGGTFGLVLQVVGWAMFGHLIGGMWAGYLLLADRSKREFTPESGEPIGYVAVVRVLCRNRDEIERVRERLEASGAIDIEVVAEARYGWVK